MKKYLLILLFITYISSIFAQKTIELHSEKNETIDFEKHILLIEDKKRILKDQDIISGKHDELFKNPPAKGLNYGISKSNVWIKFKLRNLSPSLKNGISTVTNEWILQNDYSTLDTLILYHRDFENGVTKGIGGGRILKKYHTVQYNNYIFPIQLNDNKEHTFYFKLNSAGPLNIALNFKSSKDFQEEVFITQLFYGVFFGSLVIMLLYNLFIYTVVRESSYLYYCAYIFFYVVSQISNSGHGFLYLWSESVGIEKTALLLTLHIDIFFITLFSFTFLGVKKYAPKLYKYQNFILGCCIFWSAGLFFIPFQLFILISILWTFGSTGSFFILGIYIWRYKKVLYAKYYVIGWVTFLVGLMVLNLKNIGLIADSTILHHAHQVGSVIEILFFSIALGDRINVYKAETLRIAQENERILAEQNKYLEVKVKERTLELEQSQEEVLSQYEQINQTNKELEHAYQDIRASINYAKNIQSAMLVPLEEIQTHIPEIFILWKPRDIVSGDFYWFSKVSDNKIVLAAVDCTGHGVPGAFMSLISNDLMTEVVMNRKHYEANIILEKMHKGIRNVLKQKETNNRDGMDISLCVIDKEKQQVEFAGAGNPILYVKNNELHQIKGSIFGIGGEQKEKERLFDNHIIDLKNENQEKTTFYIFSDGFQDQFGGVDRKKYGPRRMRDLLLEIHSKSMDEQRKILDKTIQEWIAIGGEKQIDDILLIGFRV